MEVRVTQDLVRAAIRQNDTRCGIALALRELSDDIYMPRVNQNTISFSDRRTGQRYTYATPAKAAKWIDSFDGSGPIPKPLTFELGEPIKARPIHRSQPSELVRKSDHDAARVTPHVRTSVPRNYRPVR